jgi:aminocarboxymuconate-semialdehyde decarboxylase
MRARIENRNGRDEVVHDAGYRYPLADEFYDPDALRAGMERRGVTFAVMSPAPPFFSYWADEAMAVQIARATNRGLAELVQARPGHLRAFATLPMQHLSLARSELDWVANSPEFVGVAVGTSIEQRPLDDRAFWPILEAVQEVGLVLLTHPYYTGPQLAHEAYYLTNLLGNPIATTTLIARFMFSGLLDHLPDLRVIAVHGGGFAPYQIGRLQHGASVRPELEGMRAPVDLIRRFYFDTLLFDPRPLRFLIDAVGADRVVLGTDTPFDMGATEPILLIDQTGLGADDRRGVLGATASALLEKRLNLVVTTP